jgi:hypothetical protein
MSSDVALHLVTADVNLIKDFIKSGITAQLNMQNALYASEKPNVTTEAPHDYFIYPKAQGYRTPAVFIVPERQDFKKQERGANHINAETRLNISVLIEDKDAERLYLKAYRYQAALMGLLDQASLTSSDGKVKLTVVVENAQFSPLYSLTKDPSAPNAVFRKEVWLECSVEHYETLK